MKLCIIGLGYIGLPTATMFAKYECDVVGVDVNSEVVSLLNEGKIHIEEPGLGELLKEVVEKGFLRAAVVPEQADAYIIAVPTPNHDDQYRSCDLTYVIEGVYSILPFVRKGNTVIVESTIAPRTMDDYIAPIFEKAGYKIGEDLFLAHCPERVLPGKILYELEFNNRIVGGVTKACTEHAAQIYKTFVKGEIIKTEAKTAELSKCMENTFRDVNIALANELAKICIDLKINCLDVIRMANKHPRVNILSPGPGVGGHCLAIDPYFISAKSPEYSKLIQMSRAINCSMPLFVVEQVKGLLDRVDNPVIAVFGVTYKGNIDDKRESPAIEVIKLLKKEGYNIKVSDSHVKDETYVSIEEAVTDADMILILTNHDEYAALDYDQLASKMRTSILFDTRNMIPIKENSKIKIYNYGNVFQAEKE